MSFLFVNNFGIKSHVFNAARVLIVTNKPVTWNKPVVLFADMTSRSGADTSRSGVYVGPISPLPATN